MKNMNIKQNMLEMVRKAIIIIQEECHELVVENKTAYDGVDDDFVTNGDKRAQEMYVEEIKNYFPGFGIIAEEEGLRLPCTIPGRDLYFTIDPLDGTKAYKRQQSHGVGTMIALVENGEILAAYVGDANTGEIYGYTAVGEETDPEGTAIRYRFGKQTPLRPNVEEGLDKQYLLLRDVPETFPEVEREATRTVKNGGLFKNLEVGGGSIGIHLARLWKGEVGGAILKPTYDTPWDLAPILGITLRLGFKFFKINPTTGVLEEHKPTITKEVVHKPYYELVVHGKHL